MPALLPALTSSFPFPRATTHCRQKYSRGVAYRSVPRKSRLPDLGLHLLVVSLRTVKVSIKYSPVKAMRNMVFLRRSKSQQGLDAQSAHSAPTHRGDTTAATPQSAPTSSARRAPFWQSFSRVRRRRSRALSTLRSRTRGRTSAASRRQSRAPTTATTHCTTN